MGLLSFLRRDETEPSYVRSSEEKALVRRLDIFLLTFGCISQGKSDFSKLKLYEGTLRLT
jgi:hypothetical protein